MPDDGGGGADRVDFIFVTSLPIAYHVARANVDMDVLTRGRGLRLYRSAITSLIYATYTIIFFALEGVIIAQALLVAFVPLPAGYLLSSDGDPAGRIAG